MRIGIFLGLYLFVLGAHNFGMHARATQHQPEHRHGLSCMLHAVSSAAHFEGGAHAAAHSATKEGMPDQSPFAPEESGDESFLHLLGSFIAFSVALTGSALLYVGLSVYSQVQLPEIHFFNVYHYLAGPRAPPQALLV